MELWHSYDFKKKWWRQQCFIFHVLNGPVSLSLFLHTLGLCCSPGSSFQEPLIASFSHCCWQFSTYVLWEPPLHAIAFFLSAFSSLVRGQVPRKRLLARGNTSAFMIIPQTLSLKTWWVQIWIILQWKCKMANWLLQHLHPGKKKNVFTPAPISSRRMLDITGSEGWGDYGKSMSGWSKDQPHKLSSLITQLPC